jgi:anti-sigma factor RsiW
MLECREVRHVLASYLEQELTAERTRVVEEHLHECDACWQAMRELSDFGLELDDPALEQLVLQEHSPLPDDFTAQVMTRIEAEQHRGVTLLWPWLRQKWSGRQYASAAYAMSATVVVVSASSVLSLWTQGLDQLQLWTVQGQAYFDACAAYMGGAGVGLAELWHGLLSLLHIG